MGLLSYVHVPDDSGEYKAFGPDDELPEWAARKMGAHCFENGEHPFSDDADGDGVPDREPGSEPPRSGRGSSRDAWATFADEREVEIPDGASRDEIVGVLLAAGVIEA